MYSLFAYYGQGQKMQCLEMFFHGFRQLYEIMNINIVPSFMLLAGDTLVFFAHHWHCIL